MLGVPALSGSGGGLHGRHRQWRWAGFVCSGAWECYSSPQCDITEDMGPLPGTG